MKPVKQPYVEDGKSLLTGATKELALKAYKRWLKDADCDAVTWMDFELLTDLAGRVHVDAAKENSSSSSSSLGVWRHVPLPKALGDFLRVLYGELERVSRGHSTELDATVSQSKSLYRRAKAHLYGPSLADDARTAEIERDAVALVNRVHAFALAGHAHRAALLWLMGQFSGNVLDAASLLVLVERQSFWDEKQWMGPCLRFAGDVLLHCGLARNAALQDSKSVKGVEDVVRPSSFEASPQGLRKAAAAHDDVEMDLRTEDKEKGELEAVKEGADGEARKKVKKSKGGKGKKEKAAAEDDASESESVDGEEGKEAASHGKTQDLIGFEADAVAGEGAGGDDAKRSKKKNKKAKKKNKGQPKKGFSVPSLAPLSMLSDVKKGKVSKTLTVWVHPSLAWVVRSELLNMCVLVEPLADEFDATRESGADWSCRLHLDTPHLDRYEKQLQDGPVEPGIESVVVEWTRGGVNAKIDVFSAHDGTFRRQVLPAADAQDILLGNNNSKHSLASRCKGQEPVVRVTSNRLLLTYASNRDVVVTWDSDLVFSKAHVPVRRYDGNMMGWSESGEGEVMFPYHVLTVTSRHGAIPKDLLHFLESPSSSYFVAAPNFDEYCTGVALCVDTKEGSKSPPWMPSVYKAWQGDWLRLKSVVSVDTANQSKQKHESLTSTDASFQLEKVNHDHDFNSAKGEQELHRGNSGGTLSPLFVNSERAGEYTPLVMHSDSSFSSLSSSSSSFGARSQYWIQQRWRDLLRWLGVLGSASNASDRPARANVKQDPKAYWANERTLLSWMSLAIFLGISAVSLLTASTVAPMGSFAQIAGTIMAPLAILVAAYSLARFHVRQRSIMTQSMRGIIDHWGPWVFIPLICAALIVMTIAAYLNA